MENKIFKYFERFQELRKDVKEYLQKNFPVEYSRLWGRVVKGKSLKKKAEKYSRTEALYYLREFVTEDASKIPEECRILAFKHHAKNISTICGPDAPIKKRLSCSEYDGLLRNLSQRMKVKLDFLDGSLLNETEKYKIQ